jgi:hypothetical protein
MLDGCGNFQKNIQVIVTYGTTFWITGCFLDNCLRGYMKAGTSSLKGVCVGIFIIVIGGYMNARTSSLKGVSVGIFTVKCRS